MRLAGDLRACQQCIALGCGWPERIDEPAVESGNQALLRDIAADEALGLLILAVGEGGTVAPGRSDAFDAGDHTQCPCVGCIRLRSERGSSIAQLERKIARDAVGRRELRGEE